MQGRATIAANFLLRALDAQPMPARGTSRTQTLHRRTRQILHRSPRFVSRASTAAKPKCPRRDARIPERMRDCEREGLVCQAKSILLVVVQFRNGKSSFWDGFGRGCMPRNETGIVFCRIGRTAGCGAILHEEARHEARALRSEEHLGALGFYDGGPGIGMAPGGTGFGVVAGFASGTFAGGAPIFACSSASICCVRRSCCFLSSSAAFSLSIAR